MKMNKEEILSKLREMAIEDTVNKHLDIDDRIRWWWSWQAAEQASEWTTKDLTEIYFEGGIKPYTSVEQVVEELADFDEENLNASFENFKEFLKGNV